MELTVIDYVVLVIAISITLGVGVFYAYKDRKHASLLRYHRGDGKLKALPVFISLLVTKQSSIFFLGYPAEIYTHGIQYFLSTVAASIGMFSIVYVSVPLFHPMGITSIYEYLEKRYGSSILSPIAIVIDAVAMTLYSAIVLFGASVALNAVTSIEVRIWTIGLASIAVVYTALGGIKAVVFADVIQCVIMVLSILAVLVIGTVSVGGIGNVVEINMPSGRLTMFDFDPDPLVRNSFWALMIGNMAHGF